MAIKITDAQGNVKTVTGGGGSAGVSSFKGRSGAVVPQKGDYTADMVGAPTVEEMNEAIKQAIQASIDASWEGEY